MVIWHICTHEFLYPFFCSRLLSMKGNQNFQFGSFIWFHNQSQPCLGLCDWNNSLFSEMCGCFAVVYSSRLLFLPCAIFMRFCKKNFCEVSWLMVSSFFMKIIEYTKNVSGMGEREKERGIERKALQFFDIRLSKSPWLFWDRLHKISDLTHGHKPITRKNPWFLKIQDHKIQDYDLLLNIPDFPYQDQFEAQQLGT